ncbi:capsular polysaccharide biosynthesis protein [Paenibacillus mucilaginosus]|uniref:YveK family protein n=1 Tax=Paenibacillus mucilaginosus TaxID=61624 RepID=UPI003D22DDB8
MELSELISIILRRIWILLIAVLVCVGAAAYVSYFHMEKEYEASASMYVLKSNKTPSNNLYQELLAGSSLVKDYKELIKSKTVLKQVKDQLERSQAWAAQMTVEELGQKLEISNKNDTHILVAAAKDTSPERAAVIANQVAVVFIEYSRQITVDESVQLIDAAEAADAPSQPKPLINMAVAAVVGVLVGLLAIFLQVQSQRSTTARRGKKPLEFS